MLPLFQSKAKSIIYSECEFTALCLQHKYVPVPYCHMWPERMYNNFSLSQKGTIFEKDIY